MKKDRDERIKIDEANRIQMMKVRAERIQMKKYREEIIKI